MRYMIIVKATRDSEAGVMPSDDLIVKMAEYHEGLAKAGMLLAADGLKPSSRGWRVRYDGEKRVVTDGPFAETKELVAGFTIIQAASREEAQEWTRRFPNPSLDQGACEIEVREIFELEDFEAGEGVARFREMERGAQASVNAR
jgi:hypothetical protein